MATKEIKMYKIIVGFVVFLGCAYIFSHVSFMHQEAFFGLTWSLLVSVAGALFVASKVK